MHWITPTGAAWASPAEDNKAIAGLLRNVSAELVRRGPGTVEYEIALAPKEEHSPGRRAPLSR